LSNNKCEQLLPSSIIGSWRFFRARVDHLHVSNNASHIFFSVAILVHRNIDHSLKGSPGNKVLECFGVYVDSPSETLHFTSAYLPSVAQSRGDLQ
jgi:hypothetical protein